ncbi:MAG: CRISPR-associated protein Cas4 [Isosphaeraceae bacterium]
MFPESELLPISALQHLHYCERQCALIHLERLWIENRFTAEGNVLHRAAHAGRSERRHDMRTVRALQVHSLALGLFGVADVVRVGPRGDAVPVEYKRGRPKRNPCDRVQVCAQALCLEEMLGVTVPHADLFYGKMRRHVRVPLDAELRQLTRESAERLHRLVASGRTPPAEPGPKCTHCSLRNLCMPELLARSGRVRSYIEQALAEAPT